MMSQLDLLQEPTQREAPRPILARSIVAAGVLLLQALAALLMMLLHSTRIHLLHSVEAHVVVQRSDLEASDAAITLGSRLTVLLLIASAVAFLMWFHRASRNLRAFRTGPFEFSPARAVWSFFIPIVSLIWPCSTMREIWQASDPSIAPSVDQPFSLARVSPLIYMWWSLFLVQGALGWAAMLPIMSGVNLDSLLLSS